MRMYDIISKKRDNLELTKDEISFFVKGFTNGSIPDYQASALLMAIFLNSMTKREISYLTLEMALSGGKTDLSKIEGITVDKHSTGGVGDKTTPIVIPTIAALGLKSAKMSGRGLGHTGGTVDKLESIPGFRTTLSDEELVSVVNRVGACMIGQSGDLAPADKKIYALRDATATVNSIPLIASSIMSKKIASGSSCIVLDVKVGSGAFMKTLDEAKQLAATMADIGKSANKKVAAVITDMNTPLGNAIGNSLEIAEAVRVLKGEQKDDLYRVSIELSAAMLNLAKGIPMEDCRRQAENAVESGKAFDKLKEITAAQGGDVRVLDNPGLFEKSSISVGIKSPFDGYISSMDSEKIGSASVVLGAGRDEIKDKIDHSAGIILKKKTGDKVKKGEVIAEFFTNKADKIAYAEEKFLSSLSITDTKPKESDLILCTVTN